MGGGVGEGGMRIFFKKIKKIFLKFLKYRVFIVNENNLIFYENREEYLNFIFFINVGDSLLHNLQN